MSFVIVESMLQKVNVVVNIYKSIQVTFDENENVFVKTVHSVIRGWAQIKWSDGHCDPISYWIWTYNICLDSYFNYLSSDVYDVYVHTINLWATSQKPTLPPKNKRAKNRPKRDATHHK